MSRIHIFAIFFYLVCLTSLCFFAGCGDTEDTEPTDPILLNYDLETEIYDLNVDELLALEIPPNWWTIEEAADLRSKYFAAQILKQYGNTPPAQIIAERERKRALGIPITWDEAIAFAKAQYLLWPNKHNREYLEGFLKRKLMEETDDPELFAKLYREILIKQHGDIPEVHIVVAYELTLRTLNTIATEDEVIAAYEAKYVLWPNETVLRQLQKYRKAKAEGTPFHLIDWDEDDE